jgi:Cadherin-like beta sandwich domain
VSKKQFPASRREIHQGKFATAMALFLGVMASILLPTESRASVNTVQFSASPALTPAFDPAVRDYVVRLTSGTQVVQVNVSNSDGADTTTTVSVDGQAPKTGAIGAQVSLEFGQGFKITAVQGASSRNYYVRSLPNGFPTWGSQRNGTPQASDPWRNRIDILTVPGNRTDWLTNDVSGLTHRISGVVKPLQS